MVRQGKSTELQRVESGTSRRLIFVQRLANLLKKAKELSILCDAEIGLIVFSQSAQRYEFASTSMEQIISRYNKFDRLIPSNGPSTSTGAGSKSFPFQGLPSSPELNALREDIAALRTQYTRMMGNDLEGLTYVDLQQLENQIARGMAFVKEKIKKDQILVEQLTNSRVQENKMALENVALRRQVEELRQALGTPSMKYQPKGVSRHFLGLFESQANVMEEVEDGETTESSSQSGSPCNVIEIEPVGNDSPSEVAASE